MASTHETIPRPSVTFLSPYAHLPADGRWEGRGTPPARLNAFCQPWQMSAGLSGRVVGASASRLGCRRGPRSGRPKVNVDKVEGVSRRHKRFKSRVRRSRQLSEREARWIPSNIRTSPTTTVGSDTLEYAYGSQRWATTTAAAQGWLRQPPLRRLADALAVGISRRLGHLLRPRAIVPLDLSSTSRSKRRHARCTVPDVAVLTPCDCCT